MSETIPEPTSDELQSIRSDLTVHITRHYAPKSSKLNRNYSDCAEWYYICKNERWI